MAVQTDISHRANRLLATLSLDDLNLLMPHLSVVPLNQNDPVFSAGRPANYVLFPHEGVISLVAASVDGETIEVATVGREGMTGIAIALGSETMNNDAMVQVSGRGSRMETEAFRKALDASPSLKQTVLRFVLAVLGQMSQNAACNRLHPLNKRCARWLLTTHDQVKGDSFGLTQEYLAMMLGVTRPSVSAAASALQAAGLIRYSRGVITIVDRVGLEAAACDCYRIIEDEFARLRGPG
ncbi:MAG: Crp/Fnr family transcriptional regulator [Caulobacteraceae bacterium]